jgi:hydroxymethylpyrimidine/phosphomethylpyrimidine kinase
MNTFAAFGVYGASVITAVSARNTLETRAVEAVSDHVIVAQIECVLTDLPICAIKIGMLPSIPGIAVLGEILQQLQPGIPMVVDPVVIEPPGKKLSRDVTLEAIENHLFPLATVITPNLKEAEILTGMPIRNMADMEAAAHKLLGRGSAAVFLKGGQFRNNEIIDLLLTPDGVQTFKHASFDGLYHGTGCALSSAVAAGLALEKPLPEAVGDAVDYVQDCLRFSQTPVKGHLGLLGHKPRETNRANS